MPRPAFVVVRLPVLAFLLALATASTANAAPPEQGMKPAVLSEKVALKTADGMDIAGTYWPLTGEDGKPVEGGPVLLLVHMEDSTRLAWEPLLPRLAEHRIAAMAIDLRGHGDSRVQGGEDLTLRAVKRDPALHQGMAEDVLAALKWLQETKKHDPSRIGLVGAGLGAAVSVRVASTLHVKLGVLVLLTPKMGYAGLDIEADGHGVPLDLDLCIISSIEDMGDIKNKNVLHVLYVFERDRMPAPHAKGTPAGPWRGKQPGNRTLGERGVVGTQMFGKVRQIEAWIAAWIARVWKTYPNPILFDGCVDIRERGDLGDGSWAAGVEVPSGQGFKGRALRWGRRVMIGAMFPDGTRKVLVRIRVSRGEIETGQYAEIEFPEGIVHAQAREHLGARQMPVEMQALVLEAEKETGPPDAKPSFEAEYHLPELPGKGPYVIHVAWGFETAGGTTHNAPGFDPERAETWTPLPDSTATAEK